MTKTRRRAHHTHQPAMTTTAADRASAARVTENDASALARLNAHPTLGGGLIVRVTRSPEFLTVIPRRPLDGGERAAVLSILPDAQVTEG